MKKGLVLLLIGKGNNDTVDYSWILDFFRWRGFLYFQSFVWGSCYHVSNSVRVVPTIIPDYSIRTRVPWLRLLNKCCMTILIFKIINRSLILTCYWHINNLFEIDFEKIGKKFNIWFFFFCKIKCIVSFRK